VTDFGSGDFASVGRTIFTLRNGNPAVAEARTYAEKVMVLPPGQRSIVHYHARKQEDIVCRAGAAVCIRLWGLGPDGGLGDADLALTVDGVTRTVAAGETVTLRPGESIYVPPFTYHQFWGHEGSAATLSVEVSSVCDDHGDNYFLGGDGERFPAIAEDEPARWVLCNEYPPAASATERTDFRGDDR
jgi:hypothetical protein